MAGLFDEFSQEYDVEGEEAPRERDPVSRVVAEIDSLSDESIDDELKEAEKRLGKAAYYKVIVRDGVIEEDGSESAAEINAEARLWARQQMAKLLGIGGMAVPAPQPAPSQFNDKEVLVIKKLVEKVLASQGERPTEPAVRKVQAQAPQAPTVRKVPTEPAAKPKPAKPPVKPKAPKPAPAASGKPRILRPRATPDGAVNYDAIPTGEVFRDPLDKMLYKFVPHPTEDNRRVKMNVTNQVRNAAALPMPMPSQMTAISAAQSMETANSGQSANTLFPDKEGGNDVFILAGAGALREKE